ncbi:hypothetical protein Tco_0961283 [Tanacetum coccineum]
MSRAPRWRVRGGNPKEEQKEGWVLVGQGHPASNRRGLSSGSSLLAEKNGSEGGWILYFRAGREVKAIREDCPPGKEEGKKALSSISTSFPSRLSSPFDASAFPFYNIAKRPPLQSLRKKKYQSKPIVSVRLCDFSGPRGLYSTHSPVSRTAQVSVRLRMRTSFPSAHSPFTRFSKQRRKGGQQASQAILPPSGILFLPMLHGAGLTRFALCGVCARRSLPVVPSSPLAVWAGCPSLLRSVRLWITGTNVVEWNSRRVTRSTVPRFEVQVVMITPGYALAPLTGTPEPANARENPGRAVRLSCSTHLTGAHDEYTEPPPCRGTKQGIASGIGANSASVA